MKNGFSYGSIEFFRNALHNYSITASFSNGWGFDAIIYARKRMDLLHNFLFPDSNSVIVCGYGKAGHPLQIYSTENTPISDARQIKNITLHDYVQLVCVPINCIFIDRQLSDLQSKFERRTCHLVEHFLKCARETGSKEMFDYLVSYFVSLGEFFNPRNIFKNESNLESLSNEQLTSMTNFRKALVTACESPHAPAGDPLIIFARMTVLKTKLANAEYENPEYIEEIDLE
jgi:hypothetical protein